MKSSYRVIEFRLGRFHVQKRRLLGWKFIRTESGRSRAVWETQTSAEQWIKDRIPRDTFQGRIVSEWFINGEKKPNGK